MLYNFVTFHWQPLKFAPTTPGADLAPPGPVQVRILHDMLAKKMRQPWRLHLFTDRPDDFERLELGHMWTHELWSDFRELGGCYTRLRAYDPDMAERIMADKFAIIDLDCVVLDCLAPLLDLVDRFAMARYVSLNQARDPDQKYNGSLQIMQAGARQRVLHDFDPLESPRMIASARRTCIGTDQAWLRLQLGAREKTLGSEHGVLEYRAVQYSGPPAGARVVFFSGPRHPARLVTAASWIREHYHATPRT